MAIPLPSKDPDEIKFYEFDWASRRLQAGEVITDSSWEVTQGSVQIANSPPPEFTGSITKVFLQGGTEGDICLVKNTIETNLNPARNFSGRIRIKEN